MSGKHDKKADDEQSANLLLTGPIAIRGLGRGVKDALLPGRPSRHRAFAADGVSSEAESGEVDPTPTGLMLTDGPVETEPGPATDPSDRVATQTGDTGQPFPQDVAVTRTEVAHGLGEDRVDERRADDERSADADVEQLRGQVAPEDGTVPVVEDAPVSDAPVSDEAGTPGILEQVVDFGGVDDFGQIGAQDGLTVDDAAESAGDAAPSIDQGMVGPWSATDPTQPHGDVALVDTNSSVESALDDGVQEVAETTSVADDPTLDEPGSGNDGTEPLTAVEDLGPHPEGEVRPEPNPEPNPNPNPEPEPDWTDPVREPEGPQSEATYELPDDAARAAEETPGEPDVEHATDGAAPEPERIKDVPAPQPGDPDPFDAEPEPPGHADAPAEQLLQYRDDPSDSSTSDIGDSDEPSAGATPEQDSPDGAGTDETRAAAEELATQRTWTTADELFGGPPPTSPTTDEESAARQTSIDDVADRARDSGEPASAEAWPVEVPDEAAVIAPAAVVATAAPPPSLSSGSGDGGRPPRVRRPAPEWFGREVVGIVVLVVLALVCGGLITAVVLKTQRDSAIAAKQAANYTPPPLATAQPAASGPVVAVIGDGTTSTAAAGVKSTQKWSSLLAKSLGGSVDADASTGMGYAAKGSSGETFVQAAAKIPTNADVVVFFGGASDSNVSSLSLAKAATDAYSAASERAPDAKLIVVGPAVTEGVSDAYLAAIRNVLRSAGAIAKATWVDPIDKSWLSTARQTGKATDLTVADEKTLASKMESAVKDALK